MPHKVKWEVVAITGKYRNAQGEEKSRYTKLGVVMENDRGSLSIKLEAIPVGWDGYAYLNDPKPRENAPTRPPRASSDSDIPF